MGVQPATRDAVLDALALADARLRDDQEALTTVLSHADLRAVATVQADILAKLLTGYFPGDGGALEAVAAMRPVLTGESGEGSA